MLLSPATCLPDHCFCEAIRATGIMQPSDAYSSLFLVIVGLLVLWSARRYGWFAYAYAAALALVGLGSFWYHADLTLLTQVFDNFGMYAVILVSMVALIVKRYSLSRVKAVATFVVLSGISLGIILVYHSARRYEFIVLILALLFLEYRWGSILGLTKRKNLYLALGVFVASGIIWILDIAGVWCMPWSIWQGHAVWHILNGIAAYLLYMHYRNLNDLSIR